MLMELAQDLARLGRYVATARRDAGYATLKQFSQGIGVSERTLNKVENGHQVSSRTLSRIATAVGWTPDSPRIVAEGGEPRTQSQPAASASFRAAPGHPTPVYGLLRPVTEERPVNPMTGNPLLDDALAAIPADEPARAFMIPLIRASVPLQWFAVMWDGDTGETLPWWKRKQMIETYIADTPGQAGTGRTDTGTGR